MGALYRNMDKMQGCFENLWTKYKDVFAISWTKYKDKVAPVRVIFED